MKNVLFFILVIQLSLTNLFAQTIACKFVDAETRFPLPNVIVKGCLVEVMSNSLGIIHIKCNMDELISFNLVGYMTKSMYAKNIIDSPIISLVSNNNELEEVVVSPGPSINKIFKDAVEKIAYNTVSPDVNLLMNFETCIHDDGDTLFFVNNEIVWKGEEGDYLDYTEYFDKAKEDKRFLKDTISDYSHYYKIRYLFPTGNFVKYLKKMDMDEREAFLTMIEKTVNGRDCYIITKIKTTEKNGKITFYYFNAAINKEDLAFLSISENLIEIKSTSFPKTINDSDVVKILATIEPNLYRGITTEWRFEKTDSSNKYYPTYFLFSNNLYYSKKLKPKDAKAQLFKNPLAYKASIDNINDIPETVTHKYTFKRKLYELPKNVRHFIPQFSLFPDIATRHIPKKVTN